MWQLRRHEDPLKVGSVVDVEAGWMSSCLLIIQLFFPFESSLRIDHLSNVFLFFLFLLLNT